MVNIINKTKKNKHTLAPISKEPKKIISEQEIRNRAFEVYQENYNFSSNELDNWYYAERELNGYYN